MQRKHIVAWSAGAMVLTDRIISFHDSPPQGAGNPEAEQSGIFKELCVFPHASERLLPMTHGVRLNCTALSTINW